MKMKEKTKFQLCCVLLVVILPNNDVFCLLRSDDNTPIDSVIDSLRLSLPRDATRAEPNSHQTELERTMQLFLNRGCVIILNRPTFLFSSVPVVLDEPSTDIAVSFILSTIFFWFSLSQLLIHSFLERKLWPLPSPLPLCNRYPAKTAHRCW